jgi:hypothetical protein
MLAWRSMRREEGEIAVRPRHASRAVCCLCLVVAVTASVAWASPARALTASLARTSGSGLKLTFDAPRPINYLEFTLPSGYTTDGPSATPGGVLCAGRSETGSFGCVFQPKRQGKFTVPFASTPMLPASAGCSTLMIGDTGTGYKATARVAAPSGTSCGGGGEGGGGGSVLRLSARPPRCGTSLAASVSVPRSGSAIHATLLQKSKSRGKVHVATVGIKNLTRQRAGVVRFSVGLNRRGRAALKRAHKLGVTLRVSVVGPDRKATTASKYVRFTSCG